MAAVWRCQARIQDRRFRRLTLVTRLTKPLFCVITRPARRICIIRLTIVRLGVLVASAILGSPADCHRGRGQILVAIPGYHNDDHDLWYRWADHGVATERAGAGASPEPGCAPYRDAPGSRPLLVDADLGQREPDRISVKSAAEDLTVSAAHNRSLSRSCCCTSTPSLVIEDH